MENLDIFNELGFEAEQVDEIERVEIVPKGYMTEDINRLYEGETFEGKPVLTEVMELTFENDGEKTTKYKTELYLINDELEEAIKVNINLKHGGDIHEDIYNKSKLFALIKGLANLQSPGCMDGYNRIKKVDLGVIRKTLEDMDSLKIEAFYGGEFNGNPYNSFNVLKE